MIRWVYKKRDLKTDKWFKVILDIVFAKDYLDREKNLGISYVLPCSHIAPNILVDTTNKWQNYLVFLEIK